MLNFFTPTPNPGGGEMAETGTTYFNLQPGFMVGPGSSFASVGTTTINTNTPFNFISDQNFVGFALLMRPRVGKSNTAGCRFLFPVRLVRNRAQSFPTPMRIRVRRSADSFPNLQLHLCSR